MFMFETQCVRFFFGCIAVKPLAPEEELQDDEETKELIMQILQRIAP